MELCEGGALRDRLAAGPLSPPEALLALAQLAAVLAAAHERGIVHGDVKPANLLLRRPLSPDAPPLADDELVLCDFGLARLTNEGGERAAAGTLAYMAPEQRRGRLDPPVDLYAAGVVTLELLGLGDRATLDRAALLRGEARPSGALPDATAAALGPAAAALGTLLGAMLAEDPAHRPTAHEAAAAARALAEGAA
jgi:serine/threonine protein kinase